MEKETRIVNHNAVVAKNNDLIAKMAKFELSELRLIAFCLAHYDSRKPENRCFVARVDDLSKLFPIDAKNAYAVVRKTMLSLNKKPLEFATTTNNRTKRHYYNWFSGFTYVEGAGEFEFFVTPEIQPYLLELSGSFTKYRIEDVYQFRAASVWKMYENLKKWVAIGRWEVALDALRLAVGVAGKYARWDAFKAHIKKTVTEINEVSDIKVSFLPIKRGRSVVSVEFTICEKRTGDENVIDAETAETELLDALIQAGLNPKTARKYAAAAVDQGKCKKVLSKLSKIIERCPLNVPRAQYIAGALKSEIYQLNLFDDDSVKPAPGQTLKSIPPAWSV